MDQFALTSGERTQLVVPLPREVEHWALGREVEGHVVAYASTRSDRHAPLAALSFDPHAAQFVHGRCARDERLSHEAPVFEDRLQVVDAGQMQDVSLASSTGWDDHGGTLPDPGTREEVTWPRLGARGH